MRKPAFNRLLKWSWAVVTRPVRSAANVLRSEGDEVAREWELAWSDREATRWRRSKETVDCFPFDDGYVATATFEDKETTWQLTPGPVPLASAFAAVRVYQQYGVTPQVDPDGRPFVALGDDEVPLQVFEEERDDVRYVYLDGFRTLEEFPDFVEADANAEHAFQRMTPRPGHPVAGD